MNLLHHMKKKECGEKNCEKEFSSIEKHLNNKYVSLEADYLKWPFVGNRFDSVQWKSGVKYGDSDVKTTLKVKKIVLILYRFHNY